MSEKQRGYPTDVSDEEWAFCAPYLTGAHLFLAHPPISSVSFRHLGPRHHLRFCSARFSTHPKVGTRGAASLPVFFGARAPCGDANPI